MIKILPPEIYTRIAAGEVIERPANVVKELLENSLDASASEIIIEIISAGKKLIRVTDNGTGMSRDDLMLCIKPHATSKISKFEDIYNLSTLGFRGEALSSIVNVSRTKISSRTSLDEIGYQIIVHGGEIVSQSEISSNVGTVVEVKDLFYNTPARLKFLKSDYTERIHIIRSIEEYAVIFKEVSFKFYSDNNLIFNFKKTNDVKDRLKTIFKNEIIENLLYFEHQDNYFKIFGFVSPIEFTQVNKSLQMFFVNNRPVSCKLLSQILYDAYKDSLPTGRHPVGIFFLNVEPSNIDVNIHPTKRMIKFKDELYLYEKLKNLIRNQIKNYVFLKNNFYPKNSSLNYSIYKEKHTKIKDDYESINEKNNFLVDLSQKVFNRDNRFEQKKFNISEMDYAKKLGFQNYTYLGQLHKTYLLLETIDGLILIDQHAASERILFEKFMKINNLSSQKLMFPINLELKFSDFESIKPYIELINQLGFEVVISGKTSLAFYSIPSFLDIKDIRDFIYRFIDNLIFEIKEESQQIRSKESVIRSACRAAIKANDIFSLSDVEKIIEDLSKCEQPFSCPHGRPTILKMDIKYIEKLFLRRK